MLFLTMKCQPLLFDHYCFIALNLTLKMTQNKESKKDMKEKENEHLMKWKWQL